MTGHDLSLLIVNVDTAHPCATVIVVTIIISKHHSTTPESGGGK
jgi:hypothetical protein